MLWQKLSIRVYLNVSQQSHPVVWHQPYSASLPHLPCKYKPDLLIITPPSTQRPSPSPPQESDSQSRLLSPAGGFQKSMWPQSWSSWGLPSSFVLLTKRDVWEEIPLFFRRCYSHPMQLEGDQERGSWEQQSVKMESVSVLEDITESPT